MLCLMVKKSATAASLQKIMELFIQRAGLRLIGSTERVSANLTRLPTPFLGRERHFCLPVRSKLEIDSQLSFDHGFVTRKLNGHNLCSRNGFLQRRLYSDCAGKDPNTSPGPPPKPNIFQKMKQMTKDYWHILIPVHVVTSIGWILIFYTAAKNSVDIIWIMEKLHLSEKYIEALRGSSAGFWAVAYALYKIFTPLRYMVTVGGTTLSIRYLSRLGYLKPKLRPNPVQKPQAEQDVLGHEVKLGKVGCKNEQNPADSPKT